MNFVLAGKAWRVWEEFDFMLKLSRALSQGTDIFIRYTPVWKEPFRWN